MMNMKEMNRELTIEELETVVGGVLPEEMTEEQIEEYIRESRNPHDLSGMSRMMVSSRRTMTYMRRVASRRRIQNEGYHSGSIMTVN